MGYRRTWSRKILDTVVFALIGVAGIPAQQQPVNTPELYRDADAYEIYSLLLPNEWSWDAARLVIRETTTLDSTLGTPDRCIQLQGEEKKKIQAAFEDFVRVNKSTWILTPLLKIAKPYDIVSVSELKTFSPGVSHVNEEDVWEQHHPGAAGYFEFSAVGFNGDRTLALVSISHYCGTLCAGGSFHLMEKKDGKWRAKLNSGTECGWIS
jgi:hypothetical protein